MLTCQGNGGAIGFDIAIAISCVFRVRFSDDPVPTMIFSHQHGVLLYGWTRPWEILVE